VRQKKFLNDESMGTVPNFPTGNPNTVTVSTPSGKIRFKSNLQKITQDKYMGGFLPPYPPRYYQMSIPSPPAPYSLLPLVPPHRPAWQPGRILPAAKQPDIFPSRAVAEADEGVFV
jgi:hypothetical protein